jgi:hypothetical protein
MGSFSVPAFDEDFLMIMNTITCGRAGTAMPTWGRVHGGTLSGEQIRQLSVVITGADLGADPRHTDPDESTDDSTDEPPPIGYWEEAQHAADELDAEATAHSTLQMPSGALNAAETTLTVSDAAPMTEGQYVRIDEERMLIIEIPSTGQRLVQSVGREPDELYVSSADGISTGEIIRLEAELLEVTGLRANGDLSIMLDASVGASDDVISVDRPVFFSPGYVVHAGSEQIEIEGAVATGQTLAVATGRAQSAISVSGSAGIDVGMRIRMGEELLEVLAIEPATITLERDPTAAVTHSSGAQILKLVEEPDADAEDGVEPEDPDTGQTLLEPLTVELDESGELLPSTAVVTGISGISSGSTYQIGEELVLVTETQSAVLSVGRGVGGTESAAHAKRVPIFVDNFLAVERGVLGTSASSHDGGTDLLFDIVEVEREVQETKLADHTKNTEIFLGSVIIVERGVLETEATDHENDTLVMNFPAPPEDPAITGPTCGQNPPIISAPPGTSDEIRPDAEQVGISLVEYEVIATPESAIGEPIDFTVTNDGTIVHNFRIVATDLAPDALPIADDQPVVDESALDAVVGGFTSLLPPGDEQIVNEDLAPGSYVLYCNIPTHYSLGMFSGFEVTGP